MGVACRCKAVTQATLWQITGCLPRPPEPSSHSASEVLGRRLKILGGIGVAGGLLAAALLFSREPKSKNPRAPPARLMNDLMSGKAAVGGPFALTDQWGRRTTLDDFRGKVVLLYFGYTYCPDVCPTDLVAIGA